MPTPGIAQHVVPSPHAAQGQVVQAGGAKYPRQLPAAQTWLPAHALPHAPQSSGSFWSRRVVRHAPEQVSRPIDAHASAWRTPSTQTPPHVLPHAPQFCPSAARSTQPLPHRVSPGRQVHTPALQISSSPQCALHAPQLSGLVLVLTHAPPQVCPPSQAQAPATQASPWPQATLQLPQCAGSLEVSTQAPPHWTCPAAQEQCPATHDSPGAQESPHVPQWAGSFPRAVHAVPQATCPFGHAHCPATHEAPVGQPTPHAPQLAASFETSVQPVLPPQ